MELLHDPEFWVAVAFVIVVVGGRQGAGSLPLGSSV